MLILYIAVGGVIGTLLRYLLGGWVTEWTAHWLPWGTLAVNIIGSVVLGFLMKAAQLTFVSTEMRGFVAVGFCGALTTFSTYVFEVVTMVEAGHPARAVVYGVGSLALGLFAIVAGILAARTIF
jgi:fluoride exporter